MTLVAQALSDPYRLRILAVLAAGRSCCDLPECGPGGDQEARGICVCELTDLFDMIQSKVSYHLGKLKKAGLIREERRGKWNYYSLNRERAGKALKMYEKLFGL